VGLALTGAVPVSPPTHPGIGPGFAGSWVPVSVTTDGYRWFMPRKRARTWAEVGIRNAGLRTTMRGLQFAMAWGLATAELGREPDSIEELAATMQLSVRTAFRDQEAFRKAFQTEDSPARINEQTGAQAQYDAAWRRLKDGQAAAKELEPLTFMVGAHLADV
jgi:hypothetical protein